MWFCLRLCNFYLFFSPWDFWYFVNDQIAWLKVWKKVLLKGLRMSMWGGCTHKITYYAAFFLMNICMNKIYFCISRNRSHEDYVRKNVWLWMFFMLFKCFSKVRKGIEELVFEMLTETQMSIPASVILWFTFKWAETVPLLTKVCCLTATSFCSAAVM